MNIYHYKMLEIIYKHDKNKFDRQLFYQNHQSSFYDDNDTIFRIQKTQNFLIQSKLIEIDEKDNYLFLTDKGESTIIKYLENREKEEKKEAQADELQKLQIKVAKLTEENFEFQKTQRKTNVKLNKLELNYRKYRMWYGIILAVISAILAFYAKVIYDVYF